MALVWCWALDKCNLESWEKLGLKPGRVVVGIAAK